MHLTLHSLLITPLGKSKNGKSITTLIVEETQPRKPRPAKNIDVLEDLTHKNETTFSPFIAAYLRPRTKPSCVQTRSSLKLKLKLQKILRSELHSTSSQQKRILDEGKLLEKFSLWLEVAQVRCPGDIQYMLEHLLDGLTHHGRTPNAMQMLDAKNKTWLSQLTLTLYERGLSDLRREQNPNKSTQIVPKRHKLRRVWQNLISTKNVDE